MNDKFIKEFNTKWEEIFGSGNIKRLAPINAKESAQLCYFILQIAKSRICSNRSLKHDSEQQQVFLGLGGKKVSLNNIGLLMLGWYSDDTITDLQEIWPDVGRWRIGNGPVRGKNLDGDCLKLNKHGGPFVYETVLLIQKFRGTIDELIDFVKGMIETRSALDEKIKEISSARPVNPAGPDGRFIINTRG